MGGVFAFLALQGHFRFFHSLTDLLPSEAVLSIWFWRAFGAGTPSLSHLFPYWVSGGLACMHWVARLRAGAAYGLLVSDA
jgi:hypothetical protein